MVIREPVRSVSDEKWEKDISTHNPNVGDRVNESGEKENDPKPSEPKERLAIKPS